MALILAIEPDRRQASRVAAIVKNRLHAEIVQADTTEHAVEALAGRVPDLILTSMLLSRKDDAALADWLRESDEAGRHVQTLVIPVLGGSRDGDDGGGLLSRFTRGRSRDDATTDGCEPEVFAAQIREYLDHAAEERRQEALLREDAEALTAAAEDREAPAVRMPVAAASRAPEPTPSLQERSWDSPYSDPADREQSVFFEVEAVTTDTAPAAADLDVPSESSEDDDAWSEIILGEETSPAAARVEDAAYADDAAPIELTSEAIDLQRFVDELSNDAVDVDDRKPSPRRKDDVLAEFEEALEVITDEPNRPDSHSEADSDVLTPLVGSTAWPHLDSTVAEPAAAAEQPADAASARPRSRKKARAMAPQEEWSLFDPEQCGFAALLAKLDQMAD
jgi:hypothetical protein